MTGPVGRSLDDPFAEEVVFPDAGVTDLDPDARPWVGAGRDAAEDEEPLRTVGPVLAAARRGGAPGSSGA